MATIFSWRLLTLLVLTAWRTGLCEESSILDGAKILSQLDTDVSDNNKALLDGGFSTIVQTMKQPDE